MTKLKQNLFETNMHTIKAMALSGLVAAALGASASAQSIGVNFVGTGSSLDTEISAGVFPQTNFNNVTGANGADLALIGANGLLTSATLTFSSADVYSTLTNTSIVPSGGDEALNTGYIYGSSEANQVSITISNIPFAQYDLFVYTLNDVAGRTQQTTVNGITYYGNSPAPTDSGYVDGIADTAYTYNRITSTDSGVPTVDGNYLRVENLSDATLTFTSFAGGDGYVNGFQIVAVPEPTTAAMLALGVVGLAARRRRA